MTSLDCDTKKRAVSIEPPGSPKIIHRSRPTTLEPLNSPAKDHLKPTSKIRDRDGSTPKLSPKLMRKLQAVKSGISFVQNLKLGD